VINTIIFGKRYRSKISSVYHLLLYPAISFFLDPEIFSSPPYLEQTKFNFFPFSISNHLFAVYPFKHTT
jgi:hypothetical protein